MEAEKVAEATPDNDQAGDPFVAPTNEDDALKALEALEAAEDIREEEAEFEDDPEPPKRPEEIQKIINAAADGVAVAEVALEKARRAYRLACQLQAENRTELTLAQMNKIQSRVTVTENRRKARAMKALGELGFGEPKRKSHPPLFQPGPPAFSDKK